MQFQFIYVYLSATLLKFFSTRRFGGFQIIQNLVQSWLGSVPGSRALLMVGFIQHASARFIGLHEAPDGHAYQLFLNNVFPEIVARPTKAQDSQGNSPEVAGFG